MSSDLGTLMLGAVDRRIGLIDRLTAAIVDARDTRYITHPLRALLMQRVFQIASGYEDGHDANTLRHDPLFKLSTGRAPLDTDNPLLGLRRDLVPFGRSAAAQRHLPAGACLG